MSDSATSDLFSYLKEQSNRSAKLRPADGSDADEDGTSSDTASRSAASSGDESESGSVADDADIDSQTTSDSTSLEFDDPAVGEQLRNASEDTLNDADFGIIRLDDDGVVQFFNDYESNLSGVDPDDALGQNYFNELAPCSNNRVFYGRFRKGLKKGEMDEHFTYTFTYKMRPTLVNVHLYRDDEGNNWIMVRKR
jgi:photoactive yellow protein